MYSYIHIVCIYIYIHNNVYIYCVYVYVVKLMPVPHVNHFTCLIQQGCLQEPNSFPQPGGSSKSIGGRG